MNYIVCQNSFVGFLSAVYDAYYEKKDAEAVTGNLSALELTDSYTTSDEDVAKAQRVRGGIIKKGGRAAFDLICDAYRSCNPDKEKIIFDYLKLFFKVGVSVNEYYGDPVVVRFNDIVSKVNREFHRIPAFIRLQEMSNGIFYGFYNSDNDLIEKTIHAMIPQFNAMKFVIHDVNRKKMAYYDGETVHYSVAPEKLEIELSDSEIFFQNLWKQYHETVAIKERKNPKLQRAFAPKKYRHFMLEF